MKTSATPRWLRRLAAEAHSDRLAADRLASLSDAALRTHADLSRTDQAAALGSRMALAVSAVRRGMHLDPHDEQIMAARALMDRQLVQVQTGEGKTISGALAAMCQALAGRHVQLVTTNDYLARRDADALRPAFSRLGLSVGGIEPDMRGETRRGQYRASVTYASHTQLGFDYLRDCLVQRVADRLLPEPDVAIVDEADAILIDEAGTPFNIARAGSRPGVEIAQVRDAVAELRRGRDYEVEPEGDQVFLTPEGEERLARRLAGVGLLDSHDPEALWASPGLARAVLAALHVGACMHRDQHYLVVDGSLVLLDEATGRPQPHRRLQHGIHAALECKEHVPLSPENLCVASVSCPGLFRRYAHLAGMTGTAADADDEVARLYGLEVFRVPPHRPNQRVDEADVIFGNDRERRRALCADVVRLHEREVPVLVGVPTEDVARAVSDDLLTLGVPVRVLSAKDPAGEAHTIADAGRLGAVTVATPLAGRGVDVRLGGAAGSEAERARVVELGGLVVLGYARRASRRLDDQLRGRAGRQGEPGRSRFYVSLNDVELRGVDDDRALTRVPSAQPLAGRSLERARELVNELQTRAARRAAGRRMGVGDLDIAFDEFAGRVQQLRHSVLAAAPLGAVEQAHAKSSGGSSHTREWALVDTEVWLGAVQSLTEAAFRTARERNAAHGGLRPVLMARHLEEVFGVYVDPGSMEGGAPDLVERVQRGIIAGLEAQRERALICIGQAVDHAVERAFVLGEDALSRSGLALTGMPFAPAAERHECIRAARASAHQRFHGRFMRFPRRWLRFFRLAFIHHLDATWRHAIEHADTLRGNALLSGDTDQRGLARLRVALHQLSTEVRQHVHEQVTTDLLTLPRGALEQLEQWERGPLDSTREHPPWRA